MTREDILDTAKQLISGPAGRTTVMRVGQF
jgi:hypothetical protein